MRSGYALWNSKHMVGGGRFTSEFPEGKMAESSLEVTDLVTFLVCKSSTNQCRQVLAFMQMSGQMGCAASSTSTEKALKLMN